MKLAASFVPLTLLLLGATTVPASGPDLSFGDADFSVQYFKQSYNASGNLIVSPVAVRLAFSALYQVTDNRTRETVQRAFYLPLDTSDARSNAEQLVNDLEQSPFLNVSFAVLQTEGQLSRELQNAIKSIFHVESRTVAFSNRRSVVEDVNKWASDVTNGRILNYLAESDVDVNVEMMLLSAMHMHANWAQKFDMERTAEETFQFRNGPRSVEMMSVSLELLYYAQHSFHAVQLPYSEESDLTMWILMPHRNGTFDELMELLTVELLDELETSAMPKMVDLWLPKFSISDSHDARDVLKRMGHGTLFDVEGFAVYQNHQSMLGTMKQSTFIQVDEWGTEAAAVTSIGTKFRIRNTQFRADKPFIFIIKKLSIDTILFVGHYSNHD
ncbi:leukocyte elastase inhibitor-like [Anopheles maculipalpis]|uniref:leukocyte elastase inhibitor-like n=1 Tax=Anopheles maculipalpis TaxID=1496333 RepID=UPI002158F5D5|nr:leukocyte elastase inhibitor-like [Anopheles maculipalpis]